MKCGWCGKNVENPFKCSFCDYSFCAEHRLPENHHCESAPPRLPLGSWEAKQRLQITKKRGRNTMMVSEGEFHFKKKELPLFEPKKALSRSRDEKKTRFSLFKREKNKK